MILLVTLFIFINSLAAQGAKELNDLSFQRLTLIGKHYPLTNWIIAFCEEECPESLKIALEAVYNKDTDVGFVNLAQAQWVSQNFKKGIYYFTRENRVSLISNELIFNETNIKSAKETSNKAKIPQLQKKIEVDFWTFRMVKLLEY